MPKGWSWVGVVVLVVGLGVLGGRVLSERFLSGTKQPQYPDHWWAPAPTEGAPDWEILPQAASREKGEVILSKRHELGCLSNFAATPFEFRGKRYASVEGFWQMMFYPEEAVEGAPDPRAQAPGLQWPHRREEVAKLTAFDAWSAGDIGFKNMRAMGINWVSFEGKRMEYWTAEKGEHYQLIVEAMRAKLAQNENVQKALISTGDLILKPDHHQPADAPPSWLYHRIWMELRGESISSRIHKPR